MNLLQQQHVLGVLGGYVFCRVCLLSQKIIDGLQWNLVGWFDMNLLHFGTSWHDAGAGLSASIHIGHPHLRVTKISTI